MEKEYKTKGSPSCVECHMGKKRWDVAATYKFNGKAKKRNVRSHTFSGAHIASMWKNALQLQLVQKGQKLLIVLSNPQPHNLPSGFGARELLVDVAYMKGNHLLKEEHISLTRHYTRKRKRVTIPHLAKKQTKDVSVPAKGKKILRIRKLQGATQVKVTLYYRLVNDEVRELLDLQDPLWSKRYFITSKTLQL